MQHDALATKEDLEELKQELTTKIDANAAKIEDNGAGISRVAGIVVENSEKLTQLTTKVDKLDGYFNSIMSTLDGLASGSAHLEQERIAMNARFDRVEKDVDNNKADIKRIKTKLAMP